ncbi:hypothetical protein Calag_1575 [Caldisphaera lagunensis DSM 15908]|uniref:Uncharacterized protein n=1 Tax=Caldisphaera lagunensis (strain DSM 15908 / JCM 11604 / ANMR 0165 / IC-154) TaxID=1056495 RepID=L0ABJ8_CALLD|nr:hypothetical protein [Caldisphaera lagunensis]AFZ71273.1 hypothetical protein Calag_1575 [Caldisphaera lagunensis DSM 15908]
MISDVLLYSFLLVGILIGVSINLSKKANRKVVKTLNLLTTISVLDLIFFMAITAGDYISRYLTGNEGISLIYSIVLYSIIPGFLGVIIASIIMGGRHGK